MINSDPDLVYILDLYNHREIYGLATIGLLVEAKFKFEEIFSIIDVEKLLKKRRKGNPPILRDA